VLVRKGSFVGQEVTVKGIVWGKEDLFFDKDGVALPESRWSYAPVSAVIAFRGAGAAAGPGGAVASVKAVCIVTTMHTPGGTVKGDAEQIQAEVQRLLSLSQRRCG
jgi:hypothetical protein